VVALVLDELASDRGPDDLHVLSGAAERLAEGLAVPAFDHLRPRSAEAEQDAAARHQVERRGRHRRHGRRPGRDLHDPGTELEGRRRRAQPGENGDGIGPPGFGRPGRVVAEPLRLARQLDQLERIRPGRRVAHRIAELHDVRC
jgi:hypothetical protein